MADISKITLPDGNTYNIKASMEVTNVSGWYTTPSKTSGVWSLPKDGISVYRYGKVVHIHLTFNGSGSAVSGPTNAFVGHLNGISGCPIPTELVTLVGYYNAVPVMAQLETNNDLTVRPMGSLTIASSGRVHLTGTFICQ